MSSNLSRDAVSGEALFILRNLKENTRLGRSNKLADVKSTLEKAVSLEFDTYFFFLRKFHYIAMDREAQLKLTDQGEQVVGGGAIDRFATEVGEFFADQISEAGPDGEAQDELRDLGLDDNENTDGKGFLSSIALDAPPPPPAHTDLLLDEDEEKDVAPPPPSRRKNAPPPPPPPVADPPAPPPAPFSLRPEAESRRDFSPSHPAHNPMPPAPAAVSPKGQDLDQRYTKFDAIGAGPLGTVFKGRHNALGLDVCVKELKDIFGYFSFLQRGEVIKRLKKEICAQAQLRHPTIVGILDQNLDVARPYFVMELMQGSLRERLDAAGGKGIEVPLAVRYFLQIAYALRAAHQTGLTHHNFKPENVLFDAWGNVRIGDFGLSRVIEVDQSKGMPQVFVGTGGMAYMAPEILSRGKDPGPSADVYSLGILLYEMLTGQLPGRRSPLPSEVNKDVPSKLDPVFDKMTQDRRESRYPDFDAMLDEFYGAFSDGEYLSRNDLIVWSDAPKA